MSIVASLKKVSKTYGNDNLIVKALDNVSLDILKGDYLAVMGASGSGKSTAMNILGCLDRPTEGKYMLNGSAVENLSDDELADLRNKNLGFVFQQFHLLSDATALGGILSNPLFKLANTAVTETPSLNKVLSMAFINFIN